MTEEECLEAIGEFNEYKLNDKYTKILDDIITRLSSRDNDKEEFFHNSTRIWFMMNPLSHVDKVFRITDVMIIADEVLHYLQTKEEEEQKKHD